MSNDQREPSGASPGTGPLFAGVDVGGTNTKIGIVDNTGRKLAFESLPTHVDQLPEAATERIGQAIHQLICQLGIRKERIVRLGLATPGPMDVAAGILLEPGNLPNWWNFPIVARLQHHAGLPVTYANDANAAAYGEYWCGAAQNFHSMVLLTLGTGIGGGIIIGDLLIEGEHGCGSECGHIIVDLREDAPSDSLHKTGSLESFCGAYSIVRRTHEALDSGRQSSLTRRLAVDDTLTPLIIAEEAEQGDELAREIVLDTASYLAVGIVTLIHTIDPNGVILAGSMNFGGPQHPLGEAFIGRIRAEVRRRILHPLRDVIPIEFATLGGDAGYIGAAGLARRAFGTHG